MTGPINPGGNLPVDFRIAVDQTGRAQFQFFADFYAATNASPVAQPVGSFTFTTEKLQNRVQGSELRVLGEDTQSSVLSPQSSFIGGSGLQSGVRTAVDPQESRRMAVVANDYASGNVLVKYTEDGSSWRQLPLSRTVSGKTYQTAFEPAAAYDQHGNLLVVYVLADVVNNSAAIVLSQKLNDRLTFSPPVALELHGAAEFVAVGRPVIAISGGRPYIAWEDQTLAGMVHHIQLYDLAARRRVEIAAGQVSHPTLAVTTTGGIVVGWNDAGQSRLLCRTGATSASLGAPVTVAQTALGYGRNIMAMADTVATPNLTMVTDATRPGVVYGTFADFNGSDLDVFFTRSTDHGQTWSTPLPVGMVKTGDQFLPTLTVDTAGFLALGFYDTRHDPTGETCHVFLRRSQDGGLTFEPEVQVTDMASNTSATNPLRSWAADYGEQMGVISRGKAGMLVLWTDTRTGSEEIFLNTVK
ncbi:MAG: glycoside hydrolase [Blastocatellia bacterium]|nr:glycoside hydrolase [Blastocatellia bacterium]